MRFYDFLERGAGIECLRHDSRFMQ
jgi:hypothetical protein